MPALTIPSTTNLAGDLQAQAADFLPKLWKKGVEISEQEEDYFNEFEGKSSDSPIQENTDLAKGAGQYITFRTMSGLYGEGAQGDEIIGQNAEQLRVGDYSLLVDFLRHSTALNKRTEQQTGLQAELDAGIPEELGRWLGRKKTQRLQMMFIYKGNASNTIYANGVGGRDLLTSADTITVNDVVSGAQRMKTVGAKPAMIGREGKNKISKFIAVGIGEGLLSLKRSSDYIEAEKLAGVRGGENTIFKGGYVDIDGNVIREFNPQDHDGFGSIGSPMNPKALLGNAIANPTASFGLYGGGSTVAAAVNARYFEFFSNYAYRFTYTDSLAADTTTQRYVLIVNLSGANAGKYGFYGFNANGLDGSGLNNLTINKALVPSTASIPSGNTFMVTTLGGAVGSGTAAGPWADANITNTHPVGSLVIETNAKGVSFGRMLLLGARAAVRGYGNLRNARTVQLYDGEFIKQTFITSVFGQSPVRRVDGVCPNYLVVEHALNYAGINLPQIIS